MTPTFEDNFSRQARTYAQHRPGYPDALFVFVASTARVRGTAWDCATGNGQAAHGIVAHVDHVVATDASHDQIAQARPHERIEYRVAHASSSGLADHSVDIVTVATALHWFDLDAFYAEVRRVLRPGGVLAAWSYFQHVVNEAVDPIIDHYSRHVVGEYWSPRLKRVAGTYSGLSFPFEEIEAPKFAVRAAWTLDDMEGYLNSWSATQKFIEVNGRHPLEDVGRALEEVWGGRHVRLEVQWPLTMRIGRNEG